VTATNAHSEFLFSYGTLQLEAVQMATFGRRLAGASDALRGFELVSLKIEDPAVVAISGKAVHTMATFTGRAADEVSGTVFAVTPDEIHSADKYEVAAVKRVAVVLQSGTHAWVYVDARYSPADSHPLRKTLLGLAFWLVLTFAFAALAAVASVQAGTFYMQLSRPAWAPAAWLFGPVWTVLYLLMAIAAWLVWKAHGLRRASAALSLFVLQLAANALWTWVFFVWHQGALAFFEILLLWALIVGTIIVFWRLQRISAALLLPYLAWVTFACALTYATWKLNPGTLA
jgi:tryptophan-rich sensory protein